MELHKLIDALRVCADDNIICPACERYDKECDGSFSGTAQLMQCAADRLEAYETVIDKLHTGYENAKGAEKSLLREVLGLFGEVV